MVSPVELRQIAYEAAATELSSIESNVVQDIVVHRVVHTVIETLMPYLDTGKFETPTTVKISWRSRLRNVLHRKG